jgi:hypothetical protein
MQEIVNPGMKVLESRRGNTGLPWTVLRPLAGTGRVWFGTISWSGTWGSRGNRLRTSRCEWWAIIIRLTLETQEARSIATEDPAARGIIRG